MAASGYGRHGASYTLNSLLGWLVGGGGPEDDIDVHGALLRKRSRDLFAGGGLGRSGPQTLSTNVTGWGIMPAPKIDGEALGLSDDERTEWERNTLREFRLWAENSMCDAERQQNFYGLQQLAFLSALVSGDCFVLFGMDPNRRTPYQTTLRILEADRVATPGSTGDSQVSELGGGARIVDGVEVDRNGRVVRFHVASRHPLSSENSEEVTYTAIDAFGRETDLPNMLHVMVQERPEQRRGVPFVAPNIETLKQFDRYMNSELAANLVSSMLTLFVKSVDEDGKFPLDDAVAPEDRVSGDDELNLELGPGVIQQLPPGKDIVQVNPLRNNTAFEAVTETYETVIGSGMEIPKEVLIKKYETNYTAARGALLDFWRVVRVYRTRFNQQFNQPVYEQWLSEAVAIGRVKAPGFFDDPARRAAWCGCRWNGASMGHVDPLKEINAAAERIRLHISTEEQETAEYNGGDWSENAAQRKKEIAEFPPEPEESAERAAPEPEEEDEE